ncbi:M23 family metallopeptidase [Vibrio sinaloensis]|uniref:M23 family metallopeptidase n=1 Tax=Photobacterium sp. (strain ATCC 43367) TaxID=379097 RepID=UPI0035EDC0B7
MIFTRQRWLYLFVVTLLVVLAATKWHAKVQRELVETQQQIVLDKAAPLMEKNGQAFQLPMEKTGSIQDFAEFGKVLRFPNRYHTADDYYALPRTEVFAIADGQVYFSGSEPAYGGLVVINHKGMYSLYGHVSAQRWLIERGANVKKGQLIGYIAETSEGYGIGAVPHLHFSIRLGSPDDFPRAGNNNWMTGYTTQHPSFVNFIDPDKFIAESKRYYRDK